MGVKKFLSENNLKVFGEGIHDGIPIALGYLAVSFSLGIAAKNAGLSAFQSFLASFLCSASAGEYVGFTLISAGATYFEMAAATLITNIRYCLMSCAMSQRMQPGTPLRHRLLMGFYVTDELFGISIARQGYLNPWYTYGAVAVAIPCWTIGTALGTIAGNLLPLNVVSALSVALFGMFLAIIIPPGRENKVLRWLVPICFAGSYSALYLPVISKLSEGTRIIILTVVISGSAALLFPKKLEDEAQTEQKKGVR